MKVMLLTPEDLGTTGRAADRSAKSESFSGRAYSRGEKCAGGTAGTVSCQTEQAEVFYFILSARDYESVPWQEVCGKRISDRCTCRWYERL